MIEVSELEAKVNDLINYHGSVSAQTLNLTLLLAIVQRLDTIEKYIIFDREADLEENDG